MKTSYDTMPGYMTFEEIDPATLRLAALSIAECVPASEVRGVLDMLGIEVTA